MISFKRNSLYLLGFSALAFLFLISYYKYKLVVETQSDGESVRVLISKLICRNGLYSKSYFVFNVNGSNHIVKLDFETCNGYRVGDSIGVFYNRDTDIYYSNKEDGSNEKLGMIISALFLVIILLDIIFPKILNLRR
jgi:hypothetical protein